LKNLKPLAGERASIARNPVKLFVDVALLVIMPDRSGSDTKVKTMGSVVVAASPQP